MKPISRQQMPIQMTPPVKTISMQPSAHSRQKLEQAAEEFEAVLVQQMLQSMQSSLENGSLFGGKNVDQIYGGIGETELAKNIAKSADFGVKEKLLEYIQKMETQTNELQSK
jgi:Rod binding domain-containing protein